VPRKWTDFEIENLRKLYPVLPNREVALRIDRTEESVKKKAWKLHLAKTYMRYKFWSEEDVEALRKQYPMKSIRELANALNRTETSVELKAKRLRLRKDLEHRDKTTQIGLQGEEFAVKFLKRNGWEILDFGKSFGGKIGCTPYDVIAEKDGKRFAINVKHMANRFGAFAFTTRNLTGLLKLDIPSAFLIIMPNDEIIFMPIIPLSP